MTESENVESPQKEGPPGPLQSSEHLAKLADRLAGRFIVIEGLDGSGITTQCQLLVSSLRKMGVRAHYAKEPTDGPIGGLIRQILRGTTTVPPGPELLALLFAADRLYHINAEPLRREDGRSAGYLGIRFALKQGMTVVCDRYFYSSVAFQGGEKPHDVGLATWIGELNRFAITPDIVFLLDVPPAVASQRVGERSTVSERYELKSNTATFELFHSAMRQLKSQGVPVHVIECLDRRSKPRSISSVQRELFRVVQEFGTANPHRRVNGRRTVLDVWPS